MHAHIALGIGPTQQGTSSLPAPASVDDFLANILGLFVQSHIVNLGDSIDDLHLLFDEVDTSSVITRVHSDPSIHSLHDQSLQVDVIVDTYVQ